MAPIRLKTKLFIPVNHTPLVLRPELIEHFNEGRGRKLTLVAAPAGFGKTTLVCQWLKQISDPVAWLSLDKDDNHLISFWQYIIAALAQVIPNFGESAIKALEAKDLISENNLTSIKTILVDIINDLTQYNHPFVLVLDDYHFIQTPNIHESLDFFLDKLPPQGHLVITSRADPPLSLSRLRVRRHLAEFRAKDLRFSIAETRDFLEKLNDFEISAVEAMALEERTDGWVAGLQLASLSLQNQPSISDFIANLGGNNRYIGDYLIEEVLGQQTKPVADFLIKTAFLKRLSAPLCNAILGKAAYPDRFNLSANRFITPDDKASSQVFLDYLDQHNLFLIPLDEDRTWYRYHHLFSDLLQAHLQQIYPDKIKNLYQQAAAWCLKEGLLDEALGYLFGANEFDHMAELIEKHADNNFYADGDTRLMSVWLNRLPEHLRSTRPWLAFFSAFRLVTKAILQKEELESYLSLAETLLKAQRNTLSKQSKARLAYRICTIRAWLCFKFDDSLQAITLFEQALLSLPETEQKQRIHATTPLADIYFSLGDLPQAIRYYTETAHLAYKSNNHFFLYTAQAQKIKTLIELGQLQAAYREIQGLSNHKIEIDIQRQGLILAISGEIYYELNDLRAAIHHLKTYLTLILNQSLVETFVLPVLIKLAWAYWVQGDIEALKQLTLEILKQIDYHQDHFLRQQLLADYANLRLQQGDLDYTLQWVVENKLDLDIRDSFTLNYLDEKSYLTLVRLWLKQKQFDKAEKLLINLKTLAEGQSRLRAMIEIQTLQALVYHAKGAIKLAFGSLEAALAIAIPEGFFRIFIDEGQALGTLLQKWLLQNKTHAYQAYVQKLLEAFPKADQSVEILSNKTIDNSKLIEPLSQRELDTLHYLPSELSVPEIADAMHVSVTTVRSHIQRIYGKLGVHSRFEAVERAKVLGLL